MNLREKILVVAIAILFVFFVHYGFNTFYKEPKYEDFCKDRMYMEKAMPVTPEFIAMNLLSCSNATTEQICNAVKGQYACKQTDDAQAEKVQECYNSGGQVRYGQNEIGCNVFEECDMCSKDHEAAQESYNRLVFIGAGVVGILAILIGAALLALESVGAGLMGGGVLTVIYGTIRYWGNLPDVGRFIMLGIVLVILIWLGYKKLASSNAGKTAQKTGKKK